MSVFVGCEPSCQKILGMADEYQDQETDVGGEHVEVGWFVDYWVGNCAAGVLGGVEMGWMAQGTEFGVAAGLSVEI